LGAARRRAEIFGVVTAMQHRLHDLSSVRSGVLLFSIHRSKSRSPGMRQRHDFSAPEELTVQHCDLSFAPDGAPRGHDCADRGAARRGGKAKPSLAPFLFALGRCSRALWAQCLTAPSLRRV